MIYEKCFDKVNHKILLRLIRRRIADQRIVRLIDVLLKAGLMEDGLFKETPEGTPQGGIVSPLLANIYLHELDMWWYRKFESLTQWQKAKRRKNGQGMAKLKRYADDFVLLWNGTHQDALVLKQELKTFLWEELHLELSEEKTHVTHIKDGFDFLGFHVQWQPETRTGKKPWTRVTPTASNVKRFKAKIKALTKRGTTNMSVDWRFKTLNRLIRGWGNYYRYANFKSDARKLDWWINQRVLLWLKKKHQGVGVRKLLDQYKRREKTKRLNRWNFAADDDEGNTVFVAKLGDIPIREYWPEKRQHPYLKDDTVGIPQAPKIEDPFLEPRVVNVPPEQLAFMEARKQVLKRDGYRCTQCGCTNNENTLQVHHVKSRRKNGANETWNLVTLCIKCHAKTKSFGRPKAS